MESFVFPPTLHICHSVTACTVQHTANIDLLPSFPWLFWSVLSKPVMRIMRCSESSAVPYFYQQINGDEWSRYASKLCDVLVLLACSHFLMWTCVYAALAAVSLMRCGRSPLRSRGHGSGPTNVTLYNDRLRTSSSIITHTAVPMSVTKQYNNLQPPLRRWHQVEGAVLAHKMQGPGPQREGLERVSSWVRTGADPGISKGRGELR